jgi:hypothetical protein
MTPTDMEDAIRNLDRRLEGVEQILPTLATKADLERFATKADLERFATKADLARFATKDDLESGLAQARAFTEQVRDDVRLLAGGYESLSTDVKGIAYMLERLIIRLEARGVI